MGWLLVSKLESLEERRACERRRQGNRQWDWVKGKTRTWCCPCAGRQQPSGLSGWLAQEPFEWTSNFVFEQQDETIPACAVQPTTTNTLFQQQKTAVGRTLPRRRESISIKHYLELDTLSLSSLPSLRVPSARPSAPALPLASSCGFCAWRHMERN